jgi:hypothetical protein
MDLDFHIGGVMNAKSICVGCTDANFLYHQCVTTHGNEKSKNQGNRCECRYCNGTSIEDEVRIFLADRGDDTHSEGKPKRES